MTDHGSIVSGKNDYTLNLGQIAREELARQRRKIVPAFPRAFQPASAAYSKRVNVFGHLVLGSDILALILAFFVGGMTAAASGMFFRGSFQSLLSFSALQQFIIFIGLGSMAMLWLAMRGHYRQRLPYWETVGHVLVVTLFGFFVCGFVQFAAQSSFSRLWLALSWLLFGAFIFFGRRIVRNALEKKGQWTIPSLVIGSGDFANEAMSALSRERDMGYDIVATVPAEHLNTLAEPNAWRKLMLLHGACHVFIALSGGELERAQPALKFLVRERMPFSIVPPWLSLPTSTLSPHHFMLHDVMLLHDTNRLALTLPCFIKRAFDLTVASVMLALLSPLFMLLTVMIQQDGGPAFFRQARVGRNGKTFVCYKFRSMRVDAEAYLARYLAANEDAAAEWQQFQKLKHDVRITPFGQFLRKSSLDELPQLLNVIKGDMSLVGPRPIMVGQEDYYADDFAFYESVRPGITGPWQVSGRNQLTFKERVHLEACYARNWSLWLDIVILLKTVPTLLKKGEAF